MLLALQDPRLWVDLVPSEGERASAPEAQVPRGPERVHLSPPTLLRQLLHFSSNSG